MGWTKRQLIDEAYAELALAGYVFDITPEEQQTALRRLDTMWATWDQRGIRAGYLFPASPDLSDLDHDSGLPDFAVETTYLNLAIRLAPGNGKQISPDTRKAAVDGLSLLLANAAMPRQQQLPGTLPRGAGNRCYPANVRGPFFRPPTDNPLAVGQGGDLDVSTE